MSIMIAQYFLNHRLDPAEITWQMEQFAAQGYDGVYGHARPGMLTPYFSADWWQALDTIIECCERLGLQFWIWDDDYFPSGLCGGRVVWSEPSLAARELRFKVAEVEGEGPFEVDFEPGLLVRAYALPGSAAIPPAPDGGLQAPALQKTEFTDLTPFSGTRKQSWPWRTLLHRAYSPGIDVIGHPHWRTAMEENRFAVVWTPPQPGRYTIVGVTTGVASADHPDLMRPEGIRLFLELTHEEYRRRYGDRFGRSVIGSFTDEPSPGAWQFPWSDGFDAEFQRDHGYSLLDHLPHLALDLDDRSPLVRHHYRQTEHRLVKANYVDQVSDWCHAHDLKHVGHLTRTEWLSLVSVWWPNELRCYQSMDIPMADPLGASCGYVDAASYHTGLKVVSSAAHLFGKQQAGADCFAVSGDVTNLRELKYLADYHLAMGINHFAVHGLSYSNDGPRKDEVPPSIFYQHTEWPYMGVWTDHVKQTAAALTGGRHVCQIAMLYPSTSLGCQSTPAQDWMALEDEPLIHAVSEALLSHQRDFDLIDEVTLQEQVDGQGQWQTAEDYRAMILPHLRYVEQAAAAALERLTAAGVRVIAVGRLPQVLGDLQQPLTPWQAAELWPEPAEALVRSLPGPELTGDGARDVFVLQREKDEAQVTFLFNRRNENFHGSFEGERIALPPRQGLLLPQARELALPLGEPAQVEVRGWDVTFEDNHLPLSFWHVHQSEPAPRNITNGAPYDLMQHHADPAGEGEGQATYICRFMLSGEIPDARIVMDDTGIGGEWRLYVNDIEINGWQRARVYDCLNLQTPVADALRTGASPLLNIVKIVTSGPGRGLKELPYLYGSFTCEYRYEHLSFPFVTGGPAKRRPEGLQPWNALGYPTYSGKAVYGATLTAPEAGEYVLDLGRVEDVAAVRVNGQDAGVLPWAPYRVAITLAAGENALEIEVANPPANRNRAAGMTAGLLGPVQVFRTR